LTRESQGSRLCKESSQSFNVLGVCYGFLYVVKAKTLRDTVSNAMLRIALRGEKVIKVSKDKYIWRNRLFYVPSELVEEFFSFVAEVVAGKVYSFEHRYDVIVDVGGFLGETAWWFITEGYAKRVLVFEPVYYELCKHNVGDVAEVYPQAVHRSKGALRLRSSGGQSRATSDGEKVVETVTLAEVLSSLTGSVAVKMDCEGCEEVLLHTPCEVIGRAEEYVVEFHPLVDMERAVKYMEDCGFDSSPRLTYSSRLVIYHFRKKR